MIVDSFLLSCAAAGAYWMALGLVGKFNGLKKDYFLGAHAELEDFGAAGSLTQPQVGQLQS